MDVDISNLQPVGYQKLVEYYDLKVIPHYHSSFITLTGRGSSHTHNHHLTEIFSKSYQVNNPNNPFEHLEFAFKYEGINLEIVVQCFNKMTSSEIEAFILEKPTSKFRRKIWFLYEFITSSTLDIPDIKQVKYEELFDPEKYYVGNNIKSKRHAIYNNMLGVRDFCPVMRKTKKLTEYEEKNLSEVAQELMNSVDPMILVRATNFLYTKETKSSFGIEKIKPDIKRTNKFVALLEEAHNIPNLDKEILIRLQNNIVDEAYCDTDYRETQNYVGELTHLYHERIHYISPKPKDIPVLMSAFLSCENRLLESKLPPVVIAAILSFGFVFLHPFEDGNGRIHRFLIHYTLSKTGYTPDNIIFPVSAVMLKNLKQYDEELEQFSKPLLKVLNDYDLNDQGELTVHQETNFHYQYIDYTHFAEYLYSCIDTTIKEDFKEELDFIVKYDLTKAAIQEVVDMPDIKIDRIIRCVAQNNGTLGKKMRTTYFSELSDEKISDIERVINEHMLEQN